MLTQKQAALVKFIKQFERKRGFSPSYAEMAKGIKLSPKSKSSITRYMAQLEQRGVIRRLPYRSRAIEFI